VILSRIFVGLTAADATIITAMFGELSNESNQIAAFNLIPVFTGLGAVCGVLLGGSLLHFGQSSIFQKFPYHSLEKNLIIGFFFPI
jgi:MFS family permease